MSREWKPGDVAMVRVFGQEHVAIRQVDGWANAFCTPYSNSHRMGDVDDVRPLVVIDPEDAEQVERLCRLDRAQYDVVTTPLQPEEIAHLQAALREFADPTPLKEPEPLGLGAVVEDAEGKRWVKVDMAMACDSWTEADAATAGADTWVKYDRLDVVRVLSPGVTEGDR